MSVLAVDSRGHVTKDNLMKYLQRRHVEVAQKLQTSLESNAVAKSWLDAFTESELYEEKHGELQYTGHASAEEDTKAALRRAKTSVDPIELVSAVEEFILSFCGFNVMKPLKAYCMVNAVHYQFNVDIDKLLSMSLSPPSADSYPTEAEKALFDDSSIGAAELLLRCVVETSDGGFLASPLSPGMPMSKLLKLPLFAQFVMVLTNAVEAKWYQEAVPTCPMAINVYASLLVEEAPVLQMVADVRIIEIMEMTKGAKRGQEVDDWVAKIRELGAIVMLDDFDAKHPGLHSKPDGIKVSVFGNAFHSQQMFKNPITEVPFTEKEQANAFDVVDYYGFIVPKYQGDVTFLVMEGSENCLKSEVGPALSFSEPKATTASAYVYQVAARAMRANQPEGQVFQMLHQGGRGLYPDEDFDEDTHAVIASSGVSPASARTAQAGTMAWMGQEAARRAETQKRLQVCGVVKKVKKPD